jgi:hypothetical protein
MKIYWPWNNLSCLGVAVGEWFYADVYPLDGWPAGIYCRVGLRRYWWTPRSLVTGRVRRTVN